MKTFFTAIHFSLKLRNILLSPLFFTFSCTQENIQQAVTAAHENWSIYRGNSAATQYSSLEQINLSNVKTLKEAWVYRTGDDTKRTTIQCNPIIINGKMFLTSPQLKVICLDAVTGKELWKYAPEGKNNISGVNRGVTYWSDGDKSRILFTVGHHLLALNAQTGELISSFGENGKVDLRENLGYPAEQLSMAVTSPGIIYKDLIILGSATGEGYNATPGHVRAYDVRTGKMKWIFHTIPQEGQPGYETWEWKEGEWYGAANVWGGLSLDEKSGKVFLATGSPSYDFYGASRIGDNLYGNSIIAVDASNGQYIWHYQVLHHDLWDYDLPCAPSLTTITMDGKAIEAVVQPTKMGYLIVLNRNTGEPLFEMNEMPVPESSMPGEVTSKTQPYPTTGFFTRQTIGKDDLRDFSTGSTKLPLEEYQKYKWESKFTPPSLEGSLAMPGTWGGGLWGGAAVDPVSQTMFINANEFASINKLRPVIETESVALLDDNPDTEQLISAGKNIYQLNCSACHGLDRKGIPPSFPSLKGIKTRYNASEIAGIIRNGKGAMPAYAQFNEKELGNLVNFLEADLDEDISKQGESNQINKYVVAGYLKFQDEKGYPLSAPPWGSLNAIDLQTGKLKWKIPLGKVEELEKMGITGTGNRNFGGCISTAGGLVFIGATTDEKIRAFDATNGEEVWQAKLPAAGFATPSTYKVNGKQYIVIAAGGGGRGGTASGSYYVAYSLPDS